MLKSVVTFLASLFAAFFRRNEKPSFLRKVTIALFLFQVILLGALVFHMRTEVHVTSPVTGEVVHVSVGHAGMHVCVSADVHPLYEDEDGDACELFNKLLRPSFANPCTAHSAASESTAISTEIVVHRLDIVYRSTRLLHQAPKNSPPCRIS